MVLKKDKKPYYDWVGIVEKYPPEYELVNILFDNDYIQPGWWTGQTWDMGKRRKGDTVVAWKRIMTHGAA